MPKSDASLKNTAAALVAPDTCYALELDYEVLRAQVANCLFQAVSRLNAANEGLDNELCLGKMTPTGAYYTLAGSTSGQRHYYLNVDDASVGQMTLTRWSEDGEQLDLDGSFDRALVAALAASVGSTIVLAFEQIVADGLHYPPSTSDAVH